MVNFSAGALLLGKSSLHFGEMGARNFLLRVDTMITALCANKLQTKQGNISLLLPNIQIHVPKKKWIQNPYNLLEGKYNPEARTCIEILGLHASNNDQLNHQL